MKADGAVVSTTNVVTDKVFESLPAASRKVIVSESYLPSASASNVIVLFPVDVIDVGVNEFTPVVAVPVSLVVNI